MTRTTARSITLLGLTLTLTACSGYQPLETNCFSREELSADADTALSATISTMGADVTRRDTACEFVMLGAGG